MELNVQDPVAVAPAATVTDGHVATNPVAGVIAVVKVTVPAKPQVVAHVGRTPTPPRLDKDRLEEPLPPVVTATGELAVNVKSLMRTGITGRTLAGIVPNELVPVALS
jgi:hypothetical protein